MFQYRLAREFNRTHRELLQTMDPHEMATWEVIHEKFDPFGSVRDDLRAGMMIAPLLNLLRRVHLVDPPMAKPSDWILKIEPVAPVIVHQTPQQMKAILKALADSMNKGKPNGSGKRR